MKNRFLAFLGKTLVFLLIFGFSGISTALALQENSFNWRNEMIGTFEPDLGEIFYGYDSKGGRVSKTWVKPSNEVIKTHYPTDSFNITYNPDGSETITKHIFLNGFPVVTIETTKDPTGAKQTKTYTNHPDHLNSVTAVSDEKADDVEHLLYQSFGRSLRGPNSIHQEQRNFTGHELDNETNYLYAGSRYLDPTIGRFISQDPSFVENPTRFLEDPQQMNSYSYSRNNPIVFVDPTGEASMKAWALDPWNTIFFTGTMLLGSIGANLTGKPATAQLMRHSLTLNPGPVYAGNGSALTDAIKNSPQYQDALMQVLTKAASEGKTTIDSNTKLSLKFDLNTDAGTAFRKMDIYVNGAFEDGAWSVTSVGADDYDFDELADYGKPLVGLGANTAYFGSRQGTVSEYKTFVNFSHMVNVPGTNTPRSKDPVGMDHGNPVYCWGQCN